MATLLQMSSLLLISFLSVVKLSMATSYTVGGSAGWTTPSRANVNYTDWAAKTTFKVGDSLEFNYVPKAHNVLEVTRTNFRFCNTTNPLASHDDASGKTVVQLAKPGNYYFIDGIADHCALGQKFQASVMGATSSSSSSIASSPSSSEPALSPSSSSSEPSAASPAIPPATAAATLTYVPSAMASVFLSCLCYSLARFV